MSLFAKRFQGRFGALWLLFCVVCGISTCTRIALLIASWANIGHNPISILVTLVIGLFFDLVVALYFSIPLILYLTFAPGRILRSLGNFVFLQVYFFICLFLLLFNAVAEWVFWAEFSVRYNFIAVDYLIYTNEVIANIRQSYPIPVIIISLLFVTVLLFFSIRRHLPRRIVADTHFPRRLVIGGALLMIGGLNFLLINDSWRNFSGNRYFNELAGNGMYQFGSAFRKNSLDYPLFYATRPINKNFEHLRETLAMPGATFLSKDFRDIRREITPDSPQHLWNVVMITVESLSAEYLQYFGNTPDRVFNEIGYRVAETPNLDSLIPHSIFFSNLYSSGTRTVRGLEALTLCMPPTPGQSVVKRLPTREDLFTPGNVLRAQGYDTKFIYGGNSYFDNMGDYYSKNGYNVVDEDAIPKAAIHHKTAWGVCDEDLFTLSLQEMDRSFQAGKPFFDQLMTVSHHRPYTYPEGRIDIPPSVQSSHSALKYCDYAIAKFLRDAQQKPWFNNTVFVIIADHCLMSSGHTDLPVNRYHIPCWIYAPALLKPRIESRLTAQIDIVPTILGLLNVPYVSKFYGYDINKLPKGRERLFLVNYQDVGFVKNGKMVVLSPQRRIRMFEPNFTTGDARPIPNDTAMINEAISYFQSASYLIDSNGYHFQELPKLQK